MPNRYVRIIKSDGETMTLLNAHEISYMIYKAIKEEFDEETAIEWLCNEMTVTFPTNNVGDLETIKKWEKEMEKMFGSA